MKSSVATLLAFHVCSISYTLAAPPPTALQQQHQQPLQASFSSSSAPTSRWRAVPDYLIASVWGVGKSKQDHTSHSDVKLARPPPSHTFARYGGDLVLRFNISTTEEAASLAEAADTLLLDVWEFSRDWVDIRLAKDIVPSLLGLLPPTLQTSHMPLLREQELVQAIHNTYPTPHSQDTSKSHHPASPATGPSPNRGFSPSLKPATGAETNIFFSDYQPLSVIEPWLRLLSSLFTTHVRYLNIGFSYEGRRIPAIRVGVHPTNSEDPNPPKRKTILIVGGLHAREWVSTTTVNYVAYSLITGYGKLQSTTKLLQDFDFVFVPTLNPDGYLYSWESDRLWRKNRQQTGVRFCQGIDLDHGFGFEWESSSNPCSESYAGEFPFEAVEAKRFADWARNETEYNNVEFVGLLDLHSYSQEILYPYSYSCRASPPGLENIEELATGLSKAIRTSHGHYYDVMPACEGNVAPSTLQGGRKEHLRPRMESSGGSLLDFFYSALNVRYSYQLKLRDRGTYGFLLPKEDIVPTGKEVLNAVLYLAAFLSDTYSDAVNEVQLTKPVLDDEESTLTAPIADILDEVEEESVSGWMQPLNPDNVQWDLKRRRRR